MTAKRARWDRGAAERVRLGLGEMAAQRPESHGGPVLMLLVAGLFAGSTLISLTVLWFTVRGLNWLLDG